MMRLVLVAALATALTSEALAKDDGGSVLLHCVSDSGDSGSANYRIARDGSWFQNKETKRHDLDNLDGWGFRRLSKSGELREMSFLPDTMFLILFSGNVNKSRQERFVGAFNCFPIDNPFN